MGSSKRRLKLGLIWHLQQRINTCVENDRAKETVLGFQGWQMVGEGIYGGGDLMECGLFSDSPGMWFIFRFLWCCHWAHNSPERSPVKEKLNPRKEEGEESSSCVCYFLIAFSSK